MLEKLMKIALIAKLVEWLRDRRRRS